MVTVKWAFDLGACHGEDTYHYLRRGCRVVALEANPQLVTKLRERFREAIGAENVVLIDKAIGKESGRIKFAIAPGHDVFGTAAEAFVERFERTTGNQAEFIEVEATTLGQLFETYGVPYYLKVDIEGFDLECIQALIECRRVPTFISVESVVTSPGASPRAAYRELSLLRSIGYSRFQFVEQSSLGLTDGQVLIGEGPPMRYHYEEGASGPFGLDLSGRWRRAAPTLAIGAVLLIRYHLLGHDGRLTSSWAARVLRRFLLTIGRVAGRASLGRVLCYDLHAVNNAVLAASPKDHQDTS
jgi:FkbM family methyltransferase